MVSMKLFAFAFAGAASAISFSEWCQHNGLVRSYNQFIKEDESLVQTIESTNDITVFIPTDDAWSRWQSQPGVSTQSFNATSSTFLYMAVHNALTIDDLQSTTTPLTSLLQGLPLHVSTTGVAPHLTVVISSGSNFTTNSTAGVINDDFHFDQGMIQLVDTVFQLPTNVLNKANKNTSQLPNGAKKNAALGALTFLTTAFAMLR